MEIRTRGIDLGKTVFHFGTVTSSFGGFREAQQRRIDRYFVVAKALPGIHNG
jgi:hypothetical protein